MACLGIVCLLTLSWCWKLKVRELFSALQAPLCSLSSLSIFPLLEWWSESQLCGSPFYNIIEFSSFYNRTPHTPCPNSSIRAMGIVTGPQVGDNKLVYGKETQFFFLRNINLWGQGGSSKYSKVYLYSLWPLTSGLYNVPRSLLSCRKVTRDIDPHWMLVTWCGPSVNWH